MTALDQKLRHPQPGEDLSQLAQRANAELEGATATVILSWAHETFGAGLVLTSSLADNVMIHLTPLCALPGEAVTKVAFPGRDVKVAAAAPAPEAAPIEGIVRRSLDLGGALSADVYCQGAKLIAVEAGGLRQRLSFSPGSIPSAEILADVAARSGIRHLTLEQPDLQELIRRL